MYKTDDLHRLKSMCDELHCRYMHADAQLREVAKLQQMQPQFSAKILASSPLVLGIEAQEEEMSRGDVSSRHIVSMEQVGARQAFCIGHMVIAASGVEASC